MDWEVVGGSSGGLGAMALDHIKKEEEDRVGSGAEKLTKWKPIFDKSFSSAIINNSSSSNPTDLSVSSHLPHLRQTPSNNNLHNHSTTTTTTTINNNNIINSFPSHQHAQYHHNPFSNCPVATITNGGSPKLAHLYVSTSPANQEQTPSEQLSPCTSLDLSTTGINCSIKTEVTNSAPVTTSTSSTTTSSGKGFGAKKPKPIPPPLDLSIGAANLSLNSPSLVTPTPTTLQQQSHLLIYNGFYNGLSSGASITNSPFYWASSPKFPNQAEKSLPLRKRWHSWSPIQMNCSDDPMLPLYTDTHLLSAKQERNGGDNPHGQGLQNGSSNQNGFGNSSRGNQQPSIFNQGTGLQTPTPFYTPNEPSPKFMNSPVFSYSTPDTSLYQGPFSPIRSSTLYPPPSSPFMSNNSSLNTPTFSMAPNILSSAPTMTMSQINNSNNNSNTSNNNNNNNNNTSSCFNMVPSTLLSPAPSQASTNSLSYEDLHEKSSSTSSLSLITPIWNIFMSGTKIRFVGGMNSSDWYFVDFLAHNGDSLGLKEDYAPNGLQVRTLVVPCSIKERIQITFCPIADPHHPPIEVNCESGHPFMVEKKGWCAVKPDAFFETYGTHCQALEGGDVCLSLAACAGSSKTPPQPHHHHQQQSQNHIHNFNSLQQMSCLMEQGPSAMSGTMTNGSSPPIPLLPTIDEKPNIPVIPHPQPMSKPPVQLNNPPMTHGKKHSGQGGNGKRSNKDSNASSGEPKGRRPMNAFLLFAKDKRPELIQQYPGKDNRSISVLLGEAWQGLSPPEKEKYAANAKLRAEEQKRMHPDCWKRKRSQSQPQPAV